MEQLPTVEDFYAGDTLDNGLATQRLLGKYLVEVEWLFASENSMCYMEYLRYIGPRAFRYYVFAAINYIRSDASAEDSSGIDSFAGMLDQWLTYEPQELAPIAVHLAAACTYILENCDKFQVDADIYDARPPLFKDTRDVKGTIQNLGESLRRLVAESPIR